MVNVRSVEHKADMWLALGMFPLVAQGLISKNYMLAIMGVMLVGFAAIRRTRLPNKFFYVLLFLLVHGLLCIVCGSNTPVQLAKQIVGISISFLFYYNYLHQYGIKRIFRYYLDIIYILALMGVIQELIGMLNFQAVVSIDSIIYGTLGVYHQTSTSGPFYRVDIIFSEPSVISTLFAPAVYYYIRGLYEIKLSKKEIFRGIIITIVYLLTFSLLSFVGFTLILLFVFRNSKRFVKTILVFFVVALLLFVIALRVESIAWRLQSLFDVFLSKSLVDTDNPSVYTWVIHLKIAFDCFVHSLGFGTGIGSYVIQSDIYKDSYVIQSKWNGVLFNVEDANSLFFRVEAELGLIGIAFVSYFIKKYHVKKNSDYFYYTISDGILVVFLIRLIRAGNYFQGDILFMVVLYILCYKESKGTNSSLDAIRS